MRALLIAVALIACGGGGSTPPGGATSPSTTTSHVATPGLALAWSPESHKVDKVGIGDGALAPDGKPDSVCIADVVGPATALFISAVTSKGEPTGDFQADTLVGNQQHPIELSLVGAEGKTSAGLAVFEDGKLLNAPDGSLKPLAAGPHKLTLYFPDHPASKDGVRLYVLMQDGSLARTPTLH